MLGGKPLAGQSIANDILDSLEGSNRPVLVYGDPDIDGLVVVKFYTDFLKERGIPYKVRVNRNRQHGWLVPTDMYEGYCILSGDFQVSKELFCEVVDSDCVWLCTDHHADNLEGEDYFSYEGSVMINPLYSNQGDEEHFQSGAGVVLDVLSHYDPNFLTEERKALVGLTLLSDVRPIDNNADAKALLECLYNYPCDEGYFKRLISSVYSFSKDFGFGRVELSRNFVDYKLNPFINAMLRFDALDDAVNFVCDGICPPHDYLSMHKRLVRDSLGWGLVARFGDLTCKFYRESFVPPQYQTCFGNFIGYLANKCEGSCLSILLDSDGKVLRASFRGKTSGAYRTDDIEGLQCLGHSSAFGVKFDEGVLDTDLIKKFAERVTQIDSAEVEESYSNVEVVYDLKDWVLHGGMDKAKTNDFTHYNKLKLRYKGNSWRVVKRTPKIAIFDVDGLEVKSFTGGSPDTRLISPVYDRKAIQFILEGD